MLLDQTIKLFTLLARWLTEQVAAASVTFLRYLLAWWINVPTPGLSDQKGSVLVFLRDSTGWLTMVSAIVGLIVAAGRVAIQRKGEAFREAFSQLFVLVIIVFTLAAGINLFSLAGDAYSTWILNEAVHSKPDSWWNNWADGTSNIDFGGTGAWLLILFTGTASIIASLIQFMLMFFRNAGLVLIVAVLPVAAASRFSPYGDNAYRRLLIWLISFELFKPVAATIYAGALRMLMSAYFVDQLMGMFLCIGAVVALPATMRAVDSQVTRANNIGDGTGTALRRIGHFVFGSTALNVGKGASILRPAGLAAGSGGARPGGGSPPPGNRPGPSQTNGNPPSPPSPPGPNGPTGPSGPNGPTGSPTPKGPQGGQNPPGGAPGSPAGSPSAPSPVTPTGAPSNAAPSAPPSTDPPPPPSTPSSPAPPSPSANRAGTPSGATTSRPVNPRPAPPRGPSGSSVV
ncbi:hypothetical protein [Actinoallomurus sp. CA-142502]|uniref:hypothetical protein n=1 Tax=Actinoallomurus sp. CA-142502 TaxID=3239885 RepID=UPI003D8B7AAD